MTMETFSVDVEVHEFSNGEVIVELDNSVKGDCPNGHVGCAFEHAYNDYVHDEECPSDCLAD